MQIDQFLSKMIEKFNDGICIISNRKDKKGSFMNENFNKYFITKKAISYFPQVQQDSNIMKNNINFNVIKNEQKQNINQSNV
jgi:hypothetical protein